ncbi:MAG: response regulator [Bacteriovoracaceae bacterium]|jgi:DNA-binding NtrC family response regulator|nr:response regulator [Bacteriovoracaceae bacterium]
MAKKIAIIDDEEDILELYKMSLDELDRYEVHCFSRPLEAIKFLRTNKVDLVICDDSMRELRGLDVLKTMRSETTNTNTLFYIASGHPDINKSVYLEYNCKRFFQKPFELEEILAIIELDLK